MIIDARELPADARLHADLAIVGAGPAGITLALELAGSGLSILLVEAGGRKPAAQVQDCFRGTVDDARHPPLSLYRARALGGTSTIWGGRCVPFDPIDFEPRPHIPHSGWPIPYAEMRRWYRVASTYCEAGRFAFDAGTALGREHQPMVPGLDRSRIEDDRLERFSPPTDFGRRYRPALSRSPSITVLAGAACVDIATAPMRDHVTGLTLAVESGRRFRIEAERVVLAAGALETARLMLATRLGGDLVGRFYMCHVEGKAAVARFAPGRKVAFEYERDREGVYVRRHFTVPAPVQRAKGLANVILRFEPPVIADPAHGDPVLSAMWLSRTFLKQEYERKLASFGYRGAEPPGRRALAAAHLANVARGAPELARFGLDWTLRHVLARRKLPYVAARGRDGAFSIDYNGEQTPNPDSRVLLAEERDHSGLPRLRVDWRVNPVDIDSVVEAHRLLADSLEAGGAGRLEVDEAAIREGYNAVGGHHMGTARMADAPSHGVVDRNCRVFGMDNLFVAGAAVFPTSSHANPTLTLVALAARLADHLSGTLAGPEAIAPAPGLAQAAE